MRRTCPVGKSVPAIPGDYPFEGHVGGSLRRSITKSITGSSPENIVARVGSNLEYALAVEEGHKAFSAKKKMIRFPTAGGVFVFAKRIRAVSGKHFMRNALQKVLG